MRLRPPPITSDPDEAKVPYPAAAGAGLSPRSALNALCGDHNMLAAACMAWRQVGIESAQVAMAHKCAAEVTLASVESAAALLPRLGTKQPDLAKLEAFLTGPGMIGATHSGVNGSSGPGAGAGANSGAGEPPQVTPEQIAARRAASLATIPRPPAFAGGTAAAGCVHSKAVVGPRGTDGFCGSCFFGRLGHQLFVTRVLCYLTHQELLRVSSVNRRWRHMALSPGLWRVVRTPSASAVALRAEAIRQLTLASGPGWQGVVTSDTLGACHGQQWTRGVRRMMVAQSYTACVRVCVCVAVCVWLCGCVAAWAGCLGCVCTDAIASMGGRLRLQSLAIPHSAASAASIAAVLRAQPDLRRLTLDGCRFAEDSALIALSTAHAPASEAGWSVPDAGGGVRAESSSPPSLCVLSLHGCHRITDAGIAALTLFPHLLSGLRVLNVGRCTSVTGAGVIALVKAATSPPAAVKGSGEDATPPPLVVAQLRTIKAVGVRDVTDELMEVVAQRCAPSLRVLDVGRLDGTSHGSEDSHGHGHSHGHSHSHGSQRRAPTPNVTDAGVVAVAAACAQLTKVGLRGCAITDASLAALAAGADGTCRLRVLDVQTCSISDAGLRHIARMPQLRTLELYGCDGITDAGLQALAAGPVARSLRRLDLTKCVKVSGAGVAALLRAAGGTLESVGLGGLPALPRTMEASLGQCAPGATLQWW